jgi:cysteine-rich repeat protein
VESGYSCVGQPSQCSTICGDGLVRGSEACDDGNQVNGDGCSSSCTIEALPALYWFGGGSAWSGQLITYAYQSHAPTPSVYPILAAAAASDNREAFVFTQTTYHVLDLTSFTWVDSGSIGSMFSGVPYSTATLRSAMGASFGTRADIYFIYGELTYIYSYDFYSGTATADSNNPYTLDHWSYCCGATVPSISSIKASWYDPANYRGWTSGSYYDICNPGCPCGVQACETGVVGPYDAHITTSSVLHIKDIGCCDRFYSQMSASSFSPFSASGAPMIYLISAAFYDPGTERLFVITDP